MFSHLTLLVLGGGGGNILWKVPCSQYNNTALIKQIAQFDTASGALVMSQVSAQNKKKVKGDIAPILLGMYICNV